MMAAQHSPIHRTPFPQLLVTCIGLLTVRGETTEFGHQNFFGIFQVWCGAVRCGVVRCGVPRTLLPNGTGRDTLHMGTAQGGRGLCV